MATTSVLLRVNRAKHFSGAMHKKTRTSNVILRILVRSATSQESFALLVDSINVFLLT